MKQQLSKQPEGLSLQLDELVPPRQFTPLSSRTEEWERMLSYVSCLGITDFSMREDLISTRLLSHWWRWWTLSWEEKDENWHCCGGAHGCWGWLPAMAARLLSAATWKGNLKPRNKLWPVPLSQREAPLDGKYPLAYSPSSLMLSEERVGSRHPLVNSPVPRTAFPAGIWRGMLHLLLERKSHLGGKFYSTGAWGHNLDQRCFCPFSDRHSTKAPFCLWGPWHSPFLTFKDILGKI